jgi:NAD(P)-dependent dehydrogenase (short-subunit alcohol dehydrogenase family)
MTGRHDGKVVIVTGGGGGIGAATCETFAQEGAKVAVLDLDERLAEAAAERLRARGSEARAYRVDVTSSAEVDAVFAGVRRDFGGIDVLVNSAGISRVGDETQDLSDEIWNQTIAVMQTGYFFCTRAAGRVMLEQRSGSVIHISSIRGFSPNPGRLAYCAAKAAVLIMAKVTAGEWAPHGVRVNAVAPGIEATPMWKRDVELGLFDEQEYIDLIPARRLGDPHDVARLCAFLASDEAEYITGACVTIDGGLTSIPAG